MRCKEAESGVRSHILEEQEPETEASQSSGRSNLPRTEDEAEEESD